MNTKELDILEKAFQAQIDSCLGGTANIGIIQTRSKLAKKLAEDGFLENIILLVDNVTISGYTLTIKGNMAYCQSSRCA